MKRNIIKKLIITRKSYLQKKNNEVYTFYVGRLFNKFKIKKEIEDSFNVKVDSVRTSIMKGSKKMKKKAFVNLKDGYKIEDSVNVDNDLNKNENQSNEVLENKDFS